MAKLPYRFICGTDQEDQDTLDAELDPAAARRVLRTVAEHLYLGELVPTIPGHFVAYAIREALKIEGDGAGRALLQQLGLKKKSHRPVKSHWYTVGKRVYEMTLEGVGMSQNQAVHKVAKEIGISESAIRESFRTYRKALEAHKKLPTQ
jgi:hypothetical protein